MTVQVPFTLRGRNPDVLTCIANLSNDEVFTPPEFANRMLDTLAGAWSANHKGANIWADKTVKFLDPCTKSGVFLREITRRLTQGLEQAIPNLEKRVNHILTRQVFGIGITQITSLLARRSVYCSKHATGKHSIAQSFTRDDGNIWFKRIKHTWDGDKCQYCGANRRDYDRGPGLETHAYAFIHIDNIKTRLYACSIADKAHADGESQRDSGSKPKVARNELPWEHGPIMPQPRRGCGLPSRTGATPLGLVIIVNGLPRVARSSQPWAEGLNPFGIEKR